MIKYSLYFSLFLINTMLHSMCTQSAHFLKHNSIIDIKDQTLQQLSQIYKITQYINFKHIINDSTYQDHFGLSKDFLINDDVLKGNILWNIFNKTNILKYTFNKPCSPPLQHFNLCLAIRLLHVILAEYGCASETESYDYLCNYVCSYPDIRSFFINSSLLSHLQKLTQRNDNSLTNLGSFLFKTPLSLQTHLEIDVLYRSVMSQDKSAQ